MPDLVRIEQYATELLSKTWTDRATGSLVDPGTVTVTITRWDGTSVVSGAATSGSGAAARTYNLTQTSLLDRLTAVWTSSTQPQKTDYIEIVGGFLFDIGELTALKPANATWTTDQKIAMRLSVEQALEDACEVAFVPRYTRETIVGDGTSGLWLRWPKLRTVRSAQATYNGTTTTLTASDLLALTWNGYGGVYGYTWTAGYPWTVGYEHGFDKPPERVKRAALMLARSWLVNGPIDDRAATFNAGADGGTYSLVVPGRNGSIFGLPEIDQVVNEYGMRVGVA